MTAQTQQQPTAIAKQLAGTLPVASPRYYTVAQFSEKNPAFTEAALRNLIFKADPRKSTRGTIPGNGLIEAGAIARVGRKVLIHEENFFQWVEGQQ